MSKALTLILSMLIAVNVNAEVFVRTEKPQKNTAPWASRPVWGQVTKEDKILLVCHECGEYKTDIERGLQAAGYTTTSNSSEETVRVVVLFPRVSIIEGDRFPEIEWGLIGERSATEIPPAINAAKPETDSKTVSPIDIQPATYMVGSAVSGGSVSGGIVLNLLSNIVGNIKAKEEADKKRTPGVASATVRVIRPNGSFGFRVIGASTTQDTPNRIVRNFIQKFVDLIVLDWQSVEDGAVIVR